MNKALFPDVTVNGVTIASAAIAAEAQNHDAPKGKPGLAWRKAARALIIRELLLQEAKKQGIKEAPREVAEGRFETDEEALIRGAIDASVEIEAPTTEEVRALWAKNPDRYRSPPLWEVSHILCAADPNDPTARERALETATMLADQVTTSPKKFRELAKSHSDCSSKGDGGVLGQLSPGDTVPEFEAALRILSEGEITTTPVASRFGYHIIRMDAVAQGATLPFAAVEAKLTEAMEKAAWAHAVQRLTQTLVDQAEIIGIDLTTIRDS